MSKHTLGPCFLDRLEGALIAETSRHSIRVPDAAYIIHQTNEAAFAQDGANAERLRDCWNACVGINPEAVPEMFAFLKKAQELLTCDEGMLRADGKCLELLGELILMVPANIIAKAEGT